MSSEQKSENILTYREKSFCRVYKTDKNTMTKMWYIAEKRLVCGDVGGVCLNFSAILVFKCYTKL